MCIIRTRFVAAEDVTISYDSWPYILEPALWNETGKFRNSRETPRGYN